MPDPTRSMREAIVAAIKAELKRQSEDKDGPMPSFFDLHLIGEDEMAVSIDGDVDLGAVADAALEARKRWHRATTG